MLKDDALLRADIFLTNIHEAKLVKVLGVAKKAAMKRQAEWKKYMIDPMKPPPQSRMSRDEVRRIIVNYKNNPSFLNRKK